MVEIKVCSLIVEIAVGLRRLPLDCGDCSHRHAVGWPTVYVSWGTFAVWLWRLQLDCGDCSWIAEIAVGLWRLQSPTRRWMTNCICKLPNFCNLSNQTAISAIRVQSQQSDCNPPELQLDYTDWFELQNRTAISRTTNGMRKPAIKWHTKVILIQKSQQHANLWLCLWPSLAFIAS